MSAIELLRVRLTLVLLRAATGTLEWRSPAVYRRWRRLAAAGLVTVAWMLWGAPRAEDDA